MMRADISIPRLAVIALVALVTSIIGGLARRRRGRGQAEFGIVFTFLRPSMRCRKWRPP
jgi:hypothetical protein